MALGFVDLEKAFDTVPREMVMATQRWMGEAELRMVEDTYEKTTARVVVGKGASGELAVKIGLRQGSVLSPLLFIAVLGLIRRNSSMQTTWLWWRMEWEREVRRRVQAEANAWIVVEGVMADRRISKRLKGKVMSTCVTPAWLYGTETLTLIELQQQRLHASVRKQLGLKK